MCKKSKLILLFFLSSFALFSQEYRTIPVDVLNSWIVKVEYYEKNLPLMGNDIVLLKQNIKELQQKTEDFKKKSAEDSLEYMTEQALLKRDYRILERKVEDLLLKCESMQKKLDNRNKFLGGSVLLNIILAVILAI